MFRLRLSICRCSRELKTDAKPQAAGYTAPYFCLLRLDILRFCGLLLFRPDMGKMPMPQQDMGGTHTGRLPMLHSDMGKMPMLQQDMGGTPMLHTDQ